MEKQIKIQLQFEVNTHANKIWNDHVNTFGARHIWEFFRIYEVSSKS